MPPLWVLIVAAVLWAAVVIWAIWDNTKAERAEDEKLHTNHGRRLPRNPNRKKRGW